MRVIKADEIISAVAKLCIDANRNLGSDVYHTLRRAAETEESPIGRSVLEKIVENADIAREKQMPICQDTGMAVFFVDMGSEVLIEDMTLDEAINEGVRRGYTEGYLRKSVVADPMRRVNTGDNTPAVVHLTQVRGDKLTITVAPKGFGSENMSGIKMLKPSDGEEGVKDFVVEVADRGGSNPCPPIVVGVGIGGTMEKAAILAKKALTLPLDAHNPDPYYAAMEDELLERINRLGIGPQGLGGRTTALKVNILTFPTHIAGLPVAVNISCHVTRHKTVVL